jgi:light-regulated signal transduction histidine kinase (bacteriophytochrome)
MNDKVTNIELTDCDREPIHMPGTIQPHGLLLAANADTFEVVGGAGDIETRLCADWLHQPLERLLGACIKTRLTAADQSGEISLDPIDGKSEKFEVRARPVGGFWLIQLEPQNESASATDVLVWLDHAGRILERSAGLQGLCDCAATVFRELTGFDRVMIYRFLDNDAGVVIAEDKISGLNSFLNHHFPASDIPRQARELYIRNRVRVIPDVEYLPQPLRPATASLASLDLSDVDLRSVSPIHIQYLKNMAVRASASISIVKDGILWGLVACHHNTPRSLSRSLRLTCQALVGGLARQIRAKEEAEDYRERLRLRGAEDAVARRLMTMQTLDDLFETSGDELRRMVNADGFVAVTSREFHLSGVCPERESIREVIAWIRSRAGVQMLQTHELSKELPPAVAYQDRASGLCAVIVSTEEPVLLMWFRAEQREVVNWAGNPHKDAAGAILTPRTSFEAWSEEVRGKSKPWTPAEIEAVHRLTRILFEARQTHRMRELTRELKATVEDKERLLIQKGHLLKEVNHRIQNSLQLVSAFLSMQAKASGDEAVSKHLAEAQKRLSAVALVHRRLYSDDNVQAVDLGRYLEDLCEELKTSMGNEWAKDLTLDLASVLIPADNAVNVGLVLTELLINATKYAYGGASGPISVSLEQVRNRFRLIVADQGPGKSGSREGFGTRMLNAMVGSLSGSIEEASNKPGLRVMITAPMSMPAAQ